MRRDDALARLDEGLTGLARLYQFRGAEETLYRALTVSQSYCLRDLHAGGPQSMSRLASGLNVRLSTMTGIVDQLEARGLVERGDDDLDRRSLRVSLTSRGRKLHEAAHRAFLSHLAGCVRGRTPAEREIIVRFLEDIKRVILDWRARPERKGRKRHG